MPRRYSNKGTTVVATSKGATTTKQTKSGPKHTYTGKGPPPSGATKVREPSYSEVPTVTVTSSGKVSTSGYRSQRAARRARRAARATKQRVRAIVREVNTGAKKRSQSAKPPKAPESYTPPKTVSAKKPPPPPMSKPAKFEGKPTAGTPTLKELQTGSKSKTLKVNKAGYVTTPKVRRVAKKVKSLREKARKSNAPLPGLDREQTKVARKVLKQGDKARATKREKLAAIETGLVESNLRNLSYGDADSQGWRQERTSIYGTGPKGPTNVKASAKRFFREVRTDAGTSSAPTPGLLAQAAQGSAFPERYDERAGEAKAILGAYNKGGNSRVSKKLKKAEAEASDLGLDVAKKGRVTKKQMTRFKAAQTAAKELNKAKLPYVWGGGHGDPKSRPTGGGLDCSGAVSYVLNKMGALKGSLVSGDMGQALEPGPGAVTVFYNPVHTFMRIGKRYFGTSSTNPGGGAGFIEGTPDDLSKYSVGHVPGLGKKVAVALGVPLTGTTSFPGMTLSDSGTTATINSGAGATVGKPGFSSAPIKLTPLQKARRTFRKLKAVGVGEPAPEESPSTTLKELEAKYSGAVV